MIQTQNNLNNRKTLTAHWAECFDVNTEDPSVRKLIDHAARQNFAGLWTLSGAKPGRWVSKTPDHRTVVTLSIIAAMSIDEHGNACTFDQRLSHILGVREAHFFTRLWNEIVNTHEWEVISLQIERALQDARREQSSGKYTSNVVCDDEGFVANVTNKAGVPVWSKRFRSDVQAFAAARRFIEALRAA